MPEKRSERAGNLVYATLETLERKGFVKSKQGDVSCRGRWSPLFNSIGD